MGKRKVGRPATYEKRWLAVGEEQSFPVGSEGNVESMRSAMLAWGRRQGFTLSTRFSGEYLYVRRVA